MVRCNKTQKEREAKPVRKIRVRNNMYTATIKLPKPMSDDDWYKALSDKPGAIEL